MPRGDAPGEEIMDGNEGMDAPPGADGDGDQGAVPSVPPTSSEGMQVPTTRERRSGQVARALGDAAARREGSRRTRSAAERLRPQDRSTEVRPDDHLPAASRVRDRAEARERKQAPVSAAHLYERVIAPAREYIATLDTAAQKRYALAFLEYLTGEGEEPTSGDYDLRIGSGAAAIRAHLRGLLRQMERTERAKE